jgi:short-subunit dehydrogenase
VDAPITHLIETGDNPMVKPLALVTGASAGLGAEFARQLAKKNYDLILVARDKARLQELAASLPNTSCEVYQADLTKAAELKHLEIKISSGQALDLLVNNAGFGTFGPFHTLNIEREEEEIRLNIVALVRLTRAALGPMVAIGKGTVLNVSSIAAFAPGTLNATYTATKAYVNSFTESIYQELEGTGVHVMAVCPGFTRTEFQDRAHIKVSHLPDFVWMSAADAVEEALYGVERRDLFCITGAKNRAAVGMVGLTPRAIARKVSAFLTRKF